MWNDGPTFLCGDKERVAFMPSPQENRPLPASKSGARPRRISQRERRRKAFQWWVTVFLAVVFIGTSVGVLILARPMGGGSQAEADANVEEQRLASAREQAAKEPGNPQWPYEVGQIFQAQAEREGQPGGHPDKVNENLDKAAEQFQAAVKIDPGYLPALKSLGVILIQQKKYQEANNVLKAGVAAEKKDIERLNKTRDKDEPPVVPNLEIRALLFMAAISLGPTYREDARMAAREALTTKPTSFVKIVQEWVVRTAALEHDKEKATGALQIAIEEARALKDTKSADELAQMIPLIMSLSAPSPAPSGIPIVIPPTGASSAAPVPVVVPPPAAEPSAAPGAAAPPPAPGTAPPAAPTPGTEPAASPEVPSSASSSPPAPAVSPP